MNHCLWWWVARLGQQPTFLGLLTFSFHWLLRIATSTPTRILCILCSRCRDDWPLCTIVQVVIRPLCICGRDWCLWKFPHHHGVQLHNHHLDYVAGLFHDSCSYGVIIYLLRVSVQCLSYVRWPPYSAYSVIIYPPSNLFLFGIGVSLCLLGLVFIVISDSYMNEDQDHFAGDNPLLGNSNSNSNPLCACAIIYPLPCLPIPRTQSSLVLMLCVKSFTSWTQGICYA